MQPTVLVMMRPTVAPPRDTECVDIPNGPQTETFFTKDLRADIAGHYRIGREARSWGVIGDSTGGYCALKMAMRHPDAYSSAVALSGAYKAPSTPRPVTSSAATCSCSARTTCCGVSGTCPPPT